MAIKHAIRKNGKGETRTVALTPLKAIRHFCIECMGFVVSEVAKCTSTSCCLNHYRFGMDPSRQGRRKKI